MHCPFWQISLFPHAGVQTLGLIHWPLLLHISGEVQAGSHVIGAVQTFGFPIHVNPLWQSTVLLHPWPAGHLFGQLPPQSIPVSPGSLWLLEHAAGLVIVQTLLTQKTAGWTTQSAVVKHALPTEHFGHLPPPQSTSVSFPS